MYGPPLGQPVCPGQLLLYLLLELEEGEGREGGREEGREGGRGEGGYSVDMDGLRNKPLSSEFI